MATGTVPTVLRGLVIPDPRWTLDTFDAANSTYSEGGPQPGEVVGLDDSSLVLDTSGTMEAGADLRGKTIRGGHPVREGARYVWRRDGDALWKGWAPHVNPTGFRFIARSTTADKWHPRHLAALSDGTVLLVGVKDMQQIVCHVIDATTGAATEVEVFDPGSAATFDTEPCLLVLPSGRVLCFFWRETGTLADVRMYYSDDGGSNWLPGQKGCLPSPYVVASFLPKRLRAVYLRGQIALFGWIRDTGTPEDDLYQWVSTDLGATFALVTALGGRGRAYQDAVVVDDAILLLYVSSGSVGYSATHLAYVRRLAGASDSMSDAEAVEIPGTGDAMEWGTAAGDVYTAGELAAWVDDEGTVYVAGVDHDTAGGALQEVMVRWSRDGGTTWSHLGYTSSAGAAADGVPTYIAGDTSTYPRDLSAIAHQGRAWLLHRHEAAPATGDDSISVLYLGGYTSVEPAQYLDDAGDRPEWVTGYRRTWLPFDLPDNTGGVWTLTTAGAPTIALTELGLHLTTAGGESVYYDTATLSGTLAEGIEALGEVRLQAGTAELHLRISDATPIEYHVIALVSTTAIALYDQKAAAPVATVATAIANGAHVQVKIAVYSAKAKMWYRHVGTHHAVPEQDWIEVGSTAALTSAAANNGHEVKWGQGASSEAYWRLVAFTHDAESGVGIYSQDNHGDLVGRDYSSRPVYLADGVRIRSVRGPAYRNEDWQITPRYDYPIANLWTPSPREPWRSVDDDAQVDLEWDLGGATWPLGSVLALYLGGCNFGTATMWGKNAGGTWVNLGTIDLRIATGLKFTRDHRVVRPDTSGGSSCPFAFPVDLLVGSHVALPWQGEGSVVRRIEANSGGTWVAGSASQDVRILLESVTGTESTAGTSAEIWSKDGLFLRPISSTYSAFRLRLPVQATAQGYFQIGSMNLGTLHHYGQVPSWGRSIEVTPIYEMQEGRGAIRRARKLAPVRRAVEMSWADGVVSTRAAEVNPDPPYVIGWTGGSTEAAVAVPALTLYDLAGLVERTSGAVVPVTYVAAAPVPANSSSIARVVNRSLLLHGRLASETWRGDVVVGQEWATEVHRGSTIRIEEEP